MDSMKSFKLILIFINLVFYSLFIGLGCAAQKKIPEKNIESKQILDEMGISATPSKKKYKEFAAIYLEPLKLKARENVNGVTSFTKQEQQLRFKKLISLVKDHHLESALYEAYQLELVLRKMNAPKYSAIKKITEHLEMRLFLFKQLVSTQTEK